jgi:glutathione S-transferase
MHSGFSNLRSALPMNLKAHHPGFRIWAGAQADVDRIAVIWRECLTTSGGPYLFGARPCMADAMYTPVCMRFLTSDVRLDSDCAAYCATIMAMPHMQEWLAAAKAEPDEVVELAVEFWRRGGAWMTMTIGFALRPLCYHRSSQRPTRATASCISARAPA